MRMKNFTAITISAFFFLSLTGFGLFGDDESPSEQRKEILAKIEEDMLNELFPNPQEGEILTFEDQYISTGGQLYEIIMGHDRFIADIRDCLFSKYEQEFGRRGHVCHPYDLAAHLIGTEAGIIIELPDGSPLDAPMNTTHPVDWVGYANQAIYEEVALTFKKYLKIHGLI